MWHLIIHNRIGLEKRNHANEYFTGKIIQINIYSSTIICTFSVDMAIDIASTAMKSIDSLD